ncbi:cytochrome P450 [Ganoderma sinense ZZ0214-1]|uniref:Cytochrome P450 n=1 Tax=Ganoderma sinense ZZ0214-1 TaxID=1077348 RepID=A0A2G8RYW5_9APHY|nr:cytochrome P450 [Ganoderma sinense ZZ0214-1]
MTPNSNSPAFGIAVALGLAAHQVFRKYETYNIGVHAAILFAPPVLLTLLADSAQPTLLRALLANFATYLTTLVISVLVYRVSPIHPLARYPGPLGCKISKFWLATRCISGFQHHYIKSLHEQYGDVVRIGPNEVSIRDSTVLNALLGTSGLPKGPHFIGRMLNNKDLPMVGIQDTETHLRRRKNWNRGMGPAAIREYEPLIAKRARQLVDRLEEHAGGVVTIGNWFNFFSYDFMSDMAFGGGSELLQAGNDRGNVWSVLEEAMFIATFFGHMPWLGVYIGKIPAATGNLVVLLNNCVKCTTARLTRGSEKKDLFHYLNNEDLPEKPSAPMQDLVDDGILAIIAGADTTSIALTSVACCLLAHPDVYARLQAEIDRFYPAGEDALDTTHYRDMPYLTAVINETLRVFPPVPGGSQRYVPHDEKAVVVGNLVLPPGTMVWPHVYSHHLDPRNFAPYTADFWPERWLLASGDLLPSDPAARGVSPSSPEFRHDEAGFIPFSVGPMNCVGKTLAMQEMRMVLCSVLQKFRMRMEEGWDPKTYVANYCDYFTAQRPELPVVLELR